MKPFAVVFPQDLKSVPKLLAENEGALPYAGGTDALARMKDGITAPSLLVNLKKLPELRIIKEDRRGLQIGSAVTLGEILDAPAAQAYRGFVEAVRSVGTIQLRNMGTIGGNLCQRPRCWYYRSSRFPCLRKGGDTCYAIYGENKYHCILGGNPCFIVHPSDTAPMLVALEAQVDILGLRKKRVIKVEDFFLLPEQNPFSENVLAKDEIVSRIVIPAKAKSLSSHYLKFRERDSFDFAMVSVAVAARVERNRLFDVRLVYGGVAPKPWRARAAEKILEGREISEKLLLEAAEAELEAAEPLDKNEYKKPLARNLLKRAVLEMAGRA